MCVILARQKEPICDDSLNRHLAQIPHALLPAFCYDIRRKDLGQTWLKIRLQILNKFVIKICLKITENFIQNTHALLPAFCYDIRRKDLGQTWLKIRLQILNKFVIKICLKITENFIQNNVQIA